MLDFKEVVSQMVVKFMVMNPIGIPILKKSQKRSKLIVIVFHDSHPNISFCFTQKNMVFWKTSFLHQTYMMFFKDLAMHEFI